MFGAIPVNSFSYQAFTTVNPSTTPGTSITAGSGAEGSWGQVIAALSYDVYGFLIFINTGNSTGVQRDYVIDIGVDPAGGTSYTTIITDLLASQAGNGVDGGHWYYFPMFIKSGSTVGARAWGNGANTIRVGGRFQGRPSRPEYLRIGQYCESIGTSGAVGTSFTPGNSGSEGSWVSLGTTTRPCWYWQVGVGIANGTVTSLMYYIDLATGDSSNKHMILENQPIFLPGTAEKLTKFVLPGEGYWEVPAGGTLYVRGTSSGTAVTGFGAIAYGVGG